MTFEKVFWGKNPNPWFNCYEWNRDSYFSQLIRLLTETEQASSTTTIHHFLKPPSYFQGHKSLMHKSEGVTCYPLHETFGSYNILKQNKVSLELFAFLLMKQTQVSPSLLTNQPESLLSHCCELFSSCCSLNQAVKKCEIETFCCVLLYWFTWRIHFILLN